MTTLRRLFFLILVCSLAGPALSLTERSAILLVWSSKNTATVSHHRAMVDQLKELRAQGHYAGVAHLDPKIMVYDFNLPEHADSLRLLHLSAKQSPYLALIKLDSKGLPLKVLWGTRYDTVPEAVNGLDQKLGLTVGPPPSTAPAITNLKFEGDSGPFGAGALLHYSYEVNGLTASSLQETRQLQGPQTIALDPAVQNPTGSALMGDVQLPDPLPVGEYRLVLTVTDPVSGKSAGESLPFTATLPNRVVGGKDSQGRELYVAICAFDGEPSPGKTHEPFTSAWISYAGKEFRIDTFRILSGTHYQWVDYKPGPFPANCVKVGRGHGGLVVCIARGRKDNRWIPGKIVLDGTIVFIAHDGKELQITRPQDMQLLVESP